jgi:site-specific recombinase XerD
VQRSSLHGCVTFGLFTVWYPASWRGRPAILEQDVARGLTRAHNWGECSTTQTFAPISETQQPGRFGLVGSTPHDLRHTAASLAVSAGANIKALQRLLGHASASMTLDIYSALFDSDLDAVAERLGMAAEDSLRTRSAKGVNFVG